MSIVSVYPGNYTPGAQTALEMTASVINATWEQANAKTDAFEAKIDAIANDWLATTAAPVLFDQQYTLKDVPQGVLDLQGSTDFRAYAQYKGAFVKGQIGGRPMLRLFMDLI